MDKNVPLKIIKMKTEILVKDIIEKLEETAPINMAMRWDNPGLLVGHLDAPVKKVVVAVDATDEVVNNAIKEKADMIITHHPLIFSGLKKVGETDFIGRRILRLAENHIALYAMHTNFDVTAMAEEAADIIGISNRSVLDVTYEDEYGKEGIGRVGIFSEDITLKEIAVNVRELFHLEGVRVYGDLDSKIDIAAVCPGSGHDMIDAALAANAKLLITGDISHHQGIDAVARGLNIIDASHYGLEKIFVDYILDLLKNDFKGIKSVSGKQEEPFVII